MKKPFYVWTFLFLLLAAAAYYGSPAVKTGIIWTLSALCFVFAGVEFYNDRKSVTAAKLKSAAVFLFITSSLLLGFSYKKLAPLTTAAAVEIRQKNITNERGLMISQIEYPCARSQTGVVSAVTITGVKNYEDFQDELYAHLGLDATLSDSVTGKESHFTAYLPVPLDTVRRRAKRHWLRLLSGYE